MSGTSQHVTLILFPEKSVKKRLLPAFFFKALQQSLEAETSPFQSLISQPLR